MIDLFYMNGYPVAVLGLGVSGLATARALVRSGADVTAWDDNEDRRAAAAAEDIPVADLRAVDLSEHTTLVLSPGIPHTHPAPHPVVARATATGLEIIGDIELLARAQRDASYIGITGTNGKSTTTALIGHIMQLASRSIAVGGNLGTPALELDPLQAGESYVLEMSSYQLELTHSITFDIAVLLNISPDHLDRHGGMDGYCAAKKLIFHRQTRPRTAVIGVDDDLCRGIYAGLIERDDQNIIPISSIGAVQGGVFVADGVLVDDTDGDRVPVMDLRDVETLPGRHNWQNAAAAYAATKAAGVQPAVIQACIRSFAGLAHRQETVAVWNGIRFVNDSKATNADAAAKALASYETIYWIAGGRAKEGGLAGLESLMLRIRHAYLIGEAAGAFAAWLDGKAGATVVDTLDQAVLSAAEQARRDGLHDAVVLLSPACASWDQFASFEVRGDAFRSAVDRLVGSPTAVGAS